MTALEKANASSDWTRRNGPQGRRDYIWLVYSVFYFIEPFFRHSTAYWVQCLGIYAVFLGLYVACMRAVTPRTSALWALSFTGLGLLSYPANPGASTFFVFTAAVFPLCAPSRKMVATVLATECLMVVAEGAIFHVNLISVASTVMFIVVIGVSNFFVGEQKRADCKLRMAHEEIEQLAAVAERERIARDLHDVLGHTLSVIVLKAELAGRLLQEGAAQDPARAAREIADVENTARTALKEVREAIGGYRAQGLAAELEQARRTLDAAGVALRCAATTPELPDGGAHRAVPMTVTQETVLSLAVREAVTNIVRHAEATECRVSISTTSGFHALEVEDDGMHRIEREGNGLRGMRERVAALGGVFSIESGAGTRLLIRLPIEAAR
ncbi:two-component system, NarL family, sensor histidine kinase DesK [Granulicella pectinivorans]|uniref:Two-component system, NarL family, sensor histidine kinase DesK n=1 Tax=Granulicella pectinivorans TaxID=474950 RepID=A0A1I6LRJ2_9BACT|nr:sensor histidine kinase [Granulicella pectinivorans]SFS05882.1 two-component system, NarL family, sensor histidine kinase DesK [Granulicella pectinivorans]